MRYVVKNLTRRPVSVLCNSGRSYHLPPKYAHELAGIEIENNAYIKKLLGRRILDVTALREAKTESEDKAAKKPPVVKEAKDSSIKSKAEKKE